MVRVEVYIHSVQLSAREQTVVKMPVCLPRHQCQGAVSSENACLSGHLSCWLVYKVMMGAWWLFNKLLVDDCCGFISAAVVKYIREKRLC